MLHNLLNISHSLREGKKLFLAEKVICVRIWLLRPHWSSQ